MRRRAFLSACAWGALTLAVRPLRATPPPFDMVRKRLAKRASKRAKREITVTLLGESVRTWKGTVDISPFELSNPKHGALKVDSAANAKSPGIALLAAVLSKDPIAAIEEEFGGIRHTASRVEAPQATTLAFRFGTTPSMLVERESWRLLEVDAGEVDGHHWKAHLSYKPDADQPHLIRITRDDRPALTARL